MISSEAAFWEGRWRSGETPWDHGEAAPPFREFVEKWGAPSGKLLLPGAGRGHDARYFAEAGAEVTALDIAPTALREAERANGHERICWEQGDILESGSRWQGVFDWVAEHTCLCAMDPLYWDQYAGSVRQVLRAGGWFVGIFYVNPHDDEGPPHRIEASRIDALFGDGFVLEASFVPQRAYPSRLGREEVRLYRRL